MGSVSSAQKLQSEDTEKKPLKIVLLGDEKVGKTAVLTRLAKHCFYSEYNPTKELTIHPLIRKIQVASDSHELISIKIWDFPDKENVDLRETYLDSADGAIVVADLTQKHSINLAETYKNEIERVNSAPIPALLIGSKLDLIVESHEQNKAMKKLVDSSLATSSLPKRAETTKVTQRLLRQWKKLKVDLATWTIDTSSTFADFHRHVVIDAVLVNKCRYSFTTAGLYPGPHPLIFFTQAEPTLILLLVFK